MFANSCVEQNESGALHCETDLWTVQIWTWFTQELNKKHSLTASLHLSIALIIFLNRY